MGLGEKDLICRPIVDLFGKGRITCDDCGWNEWLVGNHDRWMCPRCGRMHNIPLGAMRYGTRGLRCEEDMKKIGENAASRDYLLGHSAYWPFRGPDDGPSSESTLDYISFPNSCDSWLEE